MIFISDITGELAFIVNLTGPLVQSQRNLITFKVAVASALVVAFTLSPALLNLFVSYTIPGGSLIEKLHPFSYFILLAWVIDLFFIRNGRLRSPNQSMYLAGAWAIVSIYLCVVGDFGYAIVLTNNFVFPLIFISLLSTLEYKDHFLLAKIFLGLMVAQTFLVLFEFWVGGTLVPIRQENQYFRPAGFSGHPLIAGQLALLAIVATRFTIQSAVISRALIFLFLLSLLVIGSRFALLVGAVLVLIEFFRPFRVRHNFSSGLGSYILLVCLVLGLVVAVDAGAIDRFIDKGIWDSSSKSRIEVFYLFDIMSSEEFSQGVEYERIQQYLDAISQTYIESAFVAQVVLAGIFVAVIAHLLIVYSFIPVLKFSFSFFLMLILFLAFSLVFSSKGPAPLLIYFVMNLGFVIAPSKMRRWPRVAPSGSLGHVDKVVRSC